MSRQRVVSLINAVGASAKCPAHSHGGAPTRVLSRSQADAQLSSVRRAAALAAQDHGSEKDYAFEMRSSNLRYGPGVTNELGMDLANMKAKKVGVYTDPNVAKLDCFRVALDSMSKEGVEFKVYDQSRVEPTDTSFKAAIDFAKKHGFDAFVGFGGGSSMDHAKAANLYASNPDSDFVDFVAAPHGRGLRPPNQRLSPLICVPTTSGTGSETTAAAIFDFEEHGIKTGVCHNCLRPTLELVDPINSLTMPERVSAFSGFDVLCHSLESYTCLPYNERPGVSNPIDRPVYQGSNPVSDVWARHALGILRDYFQRSVFNPEDGEARSQMHMAAAFVGLGYGNAGCHLCHGLAYSIATAGKSFAPSGGGYSDCGPIIPHGLSVVITAPAVFSFTGAACPDRHLDAARLLGAEVAGKARREDAGRILADAIRGIMDRMKIPDGLGALGFSSEDVPKLASGAITQDRLLRTSPRSQTEEDLQLIYEDALTAY